MRFIRTFPAYAVAVSVLASSSLSAWAEEAAHEGAEGGGGLPQFDTSLFPEQIFWVVVSFITLYMLMNYVALPRIAHTQENRKEIITKEVETARAAHEQAMASVAAVDKSMNDARAKAQEEVSDMLAKVTEEASKRQAAQEHELLRKLRASEEEIAVTYAAAMEQVRHVANDVAVSVVDKILDVGKRAGA